MATNPRWLIGRTITGATVRSYRARPGSSDTSRAHQWRLFLDNGAELVFVTEETDSDSYGVDVVYLPPIPPAPVRRRGKRSTTK